eukprot:s159_g19.t1
MEQAGKFEEIQKMVEAVKGEVKASDAATKAMVQEIRDQARPKLVMNMSTMMVHATAQCGSAECNANPYNWVTRCGGWRWAAAGRLARPLAAKEQIGEAVSLCTKCRPAMIAEELIDSSAEFLNGTFLFEDCIADTGGAVSAGHFIHSSGSSTFNRCRALTSVGGALKVEGAQSLLQMRGGSMRFSDCWAFSNGGAVFVLKGLRQQGGDIEAINCSSTSQGGGIYIGLRDGGNLEQDAGSISLKKCYVAGGDFQFGFGGGISVGDSVRQSGTIRLEDCHVEGGSGGGMKVRRMLNVSGSMSFSSCRATKDGGAFTADSVHVEGGAKLSFDKCRAKAGGALKLDMAFEQRGGDVSFRNCSTWSVGTRVLKLMSETARHGRGGGAIWIRNGNLTQTAGGLRFYGCGGVKGGAVYISEGHLILKGGKQDYVECVAISGGGGIFLHKGHVFQQKTDLTFQSCKAQRKGGAVDVSHGSYYQSPGTLLNITKCVARDHGGGLFASESLHLADVDFHDNFAWGSGMAAIARDDVVMDSMSFTGDGESVISAPLVVVQKTVNCTASQQCRLRAREVQVNEFLCPIGTGRYKGRLAEGCLPCAAGRVQILQETNASCAACPSNSFCSAQYLQAFPGYMVSPDNISRMYHCPNSMACPGGHLPNKTKPMCGNGYTGLGCAQCETATHGKSDVDILQCIPCANERWLQAMQISWLIIKDALAFGIAGASLIGDSLEEKQSNVLLNQFMAFAVVAGSTLSSTMNTKTLKQLSGRNSDSVWWSDLLQSDAGTSLECILGYLGLPKTVWHITASFHVFGATWVAFCVLPHRTGGRRWTADLSLSSPTALAATGAVRYQPQYASWELERLVRKMFLRLFTALLPVTLFPALHMAGDTLVLIFAWTLHLHVAPYQRAKWNVTEALLLTTALLMTILSNCMIANDSHWGHSVLTQYVLFFVIVSLALVASLVTFVMFLLQVYQERFAPHEDTDRCLRAAHMLSAGFDELSQAPEPHPLLQQVVHCVRSPGDWRCPLPSAALRLAGILVELPEPSFTDALLAAGLLGALHADLVDAYAPLQVRRDAAWVLANVAAGNLSQAQRLAEQPGLAEALCDQQTKEVAQECSWAILNLLKHGPDMFTRLGIHRVLGVLLNALHSEAEASLQQAAMEQLELLTQQLTPEASGLVAKLQVLSRSPDKAVLSKAQFLLQNFFPHGSAGNTKEGSSLGCSK